MSQGWIWKNGVWLPYAEATTHVLTHSLHYGSSVFEGIRAYAQVGGGSAIFKLPEHIDRFFYSAAQLNMTLPYDRETLIQAACDCVVRNGEDNAYIRPLAYYGEASLKVCPDPSVPVDVILYSWPAIDYFTGDHVSLGTSPYIRIHPRSSVVDAKIGGHYVNSLIAGMHAKQQGFHDALLLDDQGYVAETTASNVFFVKDKVLFTTPLGTILPGLTRGALITLAEEAGLTVKERLFKPEALLSADEAFVCGTAVEVRPIGQLDNQVIGTGVAGPITQQLMAAYQAARSGEIPAFSDWLTCLG